ncbi:hypothetical protein QNH20_21640 [Neobacillus sp. WH10]|nr:hypothetical protein [Neobacillus sp. WH10]WHY76667.1 hypothetical protein QNH20_21640 [Neobacillus sp. WH10]
MKKFALLLFSISLLTLITSTKDVEKQRSHTDVAYSQTDDYPIHPPVG